MYDGRTYCEGSSHGFYWPEKDGYGWRTEMHLDSYSGWAIFEKGYADTEKEVKLEINKSIQKYQELHCCSGEIKYIEINWGDYID